MAAHEKADAVVQAAESQLGSPYVFGAWGGFCTPAYRKQYAGYNPQHQDKIYKACPVLSGKQSACDGCSWQGKRAFDCRGFTFWCLSQAGILLAGGGATSQYDANANWERKGPVSKMPDLVCCLFKDQNGTKTHTGLHIGGGEIVHCSGTVTRGRITEGGWTHYALPKGLYAADEITGAEAVKFHAVLKRGSTGDEVKILQDCLKALGYDCGKTDGAFGAQTEAAVRSFQAANGLTVDGRVGSATWAALEKAAGDDEEGESPDESPDEMTVGAPASPAGEPLCLDAGLCGDPVIMSRGDFDAMKVAFSAAYQVFKRYESAK